MLKISQGKSDRMPFSLDSLQRDNIVAVMDEVHGVIWLWMGADTGLVQRRSAMRVAQSLKTYGHTIGPTIVGRNLSDVIPIDGRVIDTDSLMKGRFEKVKELFQMEHNIEADVLAVFKTVSYDSQPTYYGLSKEQRDTLVAAAIAAPAVGVDERDIEEVVGQYRPPPATKESTVVVEEEKAKKIEISDELIGEVKASIVISSILTEFNDLFVSIGKDDKGRKAYTIENADGLICKFALDGKNIRFLPESWKNVDKETKTKIQKVFIDRTKTLLSNIQ